MIIRTIPDSAGHSKESPQNLGLDDIIPVYIRIRRYTVALRKRVEVLFDEDRFTYLEGVARREKTSVGNLIREAVEKVYLDTDQKQRWEAFKRLTSEEFDFGDWDAIKEEMLRNTLNKGSEGFSGGYWGSFAEILRPPGLFSQMCRPLISLRRGRCNL